MIEAVGISFVYPDGTKALDGIGFRVDRGECVGIVGPSGAGKSTLANILVGFVFPRTGKISVDGIEINKKNMEAIRKKVGLIFQNPDDQLFMPTLYDDVAFGPLQRGMNGGELDTKVRKAISDRGLDGLENKFPGHLSGGQKRLAALAGVLVMTPEVLVLDEPSSNLDPKSRRNLINQLNKLDNTRLVVGHDLEMVIDICDRVFVLNAGKIVADGAPSEVLADAALMESSGLEAPHSLMHSAHGGCRLSRL